MKKIVVVAGIVLASTTLVPAPVNAAPKSLVIIDSYFDSRVTGGNVSCVTLQGQACQDVVLKSAIPASISSTINHGDAMAEVAKRQDPNLPIILLGSVTPSPTYVADVNAGNFVDALNWVIKNSNTVGAVSVSRYFNGNATCTPSSVNTAAYGGIAKIDNTIRQLILQLKSKGIPLFASTGNTPGKPIDYPACITDTNSVSSGVGGVPYLIGNYDNNTDYFGNLPANTFSYKSPVFGLIPQTTSSATVATAAKYLTNILDKRFVNVLQ